MEENQEKKRFDTENFKNKKKESRNFHSVVSGKKLAYEKYHSGKMMNKLIYFNCEICTQNGIKPKGNK